MSCLWLPPTQPKPLYTLALSYSTSSQLLTPRSGLCLRLLSERERWDSNTSRERLLNVKTILSDQYRSLLLSTSPETSFSPPGTSRPLLWTFVSSANIQHQSHITITVIDVFICKSPTLRSVSHSFTFLYHHRYLSVILFLQKYYFQARGFRFKSAKEYFRGRIIIVFACKRKRMDYS